MQVIPKSPRESIRLQIAEFHGSRYLDVRIWADIGDGRPRPTRQGVTVPLKHIAAFVDAVAQVGREARPDGA